MNTEQLIIFMQEISNKGPSITSEQVNALAHTIEQQTPTPKEVQEAVTHIQANVSMRLLRLEPMPTQEGTPAPSLVDVIQNLNACLDILYDANATKSTFTLTEQEAQAVHTLSLQAQKLIHDVQARERGEIHE